MKVEVLENGARWTLPMTVAQWIETLPLLAAAQLEALVKELNIDSTTYSLQLDDLAIANLSASCSSELKLPQNVNFSFDLRLTGVLGKPNASLSTRWLQPGKSMPVRGVEQSGCWLKQNETVFRIAEPIFSVTCLVSQFNICPSDALEEQFRIWGNIRRLLGDSRADSITDGFLRSFRVITASAFSFKITTDERGDIQIAPVLLSEQANTDGVPRHTNSLNEADEELFTERLDTLRPNIPTFPLSHGTYVVVEPELQAQLAAIKEIRSASPEKRKQAALHPEAVIREILQLEEDVPTLFVETEKFSERVADVGEWVTPILPWIKIASQSWEPPAGFGVRIDGVDIPLDRDKLNQTINEMEGAISAGKKTIPFGDATLPAHSANLTALKDLQTAILKADQPAGVDERTQYSSKILIIETNFNDTSYNQVKVSSRPGTLGLPYLLQTVPKPHQETGLEWLQQHWISGSKGALLCDDMGLGKTYQALAFCAWLIELMAEGRVTKRPILLVAPVGLLRTWEKEQDTHLRDPGLGHLVRAYGEHLKALKRGRHSDGTAGLDTTRLSSADVVLANYESVSDYQLSFGAIQFATVILDEAQKIKSPKARMTHAIKALNTEFMIGMTGTPVENRLADLWCISDAVQPGALGDLKSFSSTYEVESGAAVLELRDSIWQDEENIDSKPKLLLRRLKSEKLVGLPEKHEHVIKHVMPPRQLEAYYRALALKELKGPGGTLGMIQALRNISLHPILVEGKQDENAELIAEDSARFLGALSVLDQVHKTGEKALIFLESLDLQSVTQLPLLLKRRYGLADLPMVINGEVSTDKRQERVDKFQIAAGFDVMLLSPKAGGVGLTLTAANHVIHLSRWWNPAVEDQCSDRVYRIGQEKTVHIYYPLATLPDSENGSFDMQLQTLMNRKRQMAKNLLMPQQFTKDDYDELIKGVGGVEHKMPH